MLDFFKKLFAKKDTGTILNPGPDTSAGGKLDIVDIKKIVRDTLIAAASAALTVLINYEGSLDLGEYQVAIIPVVHFVLTTALKYVNSAKNV